MTTSTCDIKTKDTFAAVGENLVDIDPSGRFIIVNINSDWSTNLFTASTFDDMGWFWTDEWQAGERKASEDLESGRFVDFDTIDEVIEYLNAQGAAKNNTKKD